MGAKVKVDVQIPLKDSAAGLMAVAFGRRMADLEARVQRLEKQMEEVQNGREIRNSVGSDGETEGRGQESSG